MARDREVQRMLFDAGLAGICVPRSTAARGSPPPTSRSLNEELEGYEYPMRFQVPTMSPCAAVLLDFGTEEQKQRHIPAILKGEEIWMQFLSEPSGGSDVAGALTTAVRDGDEWVLNGSKVWTTGAWWSDWGLCLARTNWDVPKHRGLTVFMLPIHQEGIEMHRIEMLNGNREFCQEFLTDVRVPDTDRIGEVDDGWTVGTRWMFHERMLYNSPLVTFPTGTRARRRATALDALAGPRRRPARRPAWPATWSARRACSTLVGDALRRRIGAGHRDRHDVRPVLGHRPPVPRHRAAPGARPSPTSSPARPARRGRRRRRRWPARATTSSCARSACIGGGTTEMARNVISERVLGMPRERTSTGTCRSATCRAARRVIRGVSWWGSRDRWRSTTGPASAW